MKKKDNIPRGIRNNNPLNIRRGKQKWQGEIERSEASSSSGKTGDEVFVQFTSMEWGLRAGFCILHTYAVKYRRNSVNSIIARWAPATENNTAQYIRNVCQWTGFGGNQRLTEAEWPTLVKAMCRMECGVLLDDAVIERAFALYRGSPTQGGATAKTN